MLAAMATMPVATCRRLFLFYVIVFWARGSCNERSEATSGMPVPDLTSLISLLVTDSSDCSVDVGELSMTDPSVDSSLTICEGVSEVLSSQSWSRGSCSIVRGR